ncbi:MAG TPA: hypothetical protein VFG86_16085 [Chloroflexota bacterium]|jgi:hypothetical protein|nr:hypothetical protein [Chloroflexota bacterium]
MFRKLVALSTVAILLLASMPTLARASNDASLSDALITGFIDSPSSAAILAPGQPFTVKGWLVDKSSSASVGVDTIGVWAQPAGQPWIDLGHARLALSRPDVAAALNNPNWSTAGYSLDVTSGLPAGNYTLSITAHTKSIGWVNRMVPLTVAAPVAVAATPTALPAAPLAAPATPTPPARAAPSAERWTAYGFNVDAPRSMWPMLELLHRYTFDWALASASSRPTPIRWVDTLPSGVYGSYEPKENTIGLSKVLQSTSLEARATLLAHELTHLNDDLNGALGDATGDSCYAAETRAFVNEGNLWSMLFGPEGKVGTDAVEEQENTKMWAFSGNPRFANLVVRTTDTYVQQCSH